MPHQALSRPHSLPTDPMFPERFFSGYVRGRGNDGNRPSLLTGSHVVMLPLNIPWKPSMSSKEFGEIFLFYSGEET